MADPCTCHRDIEAKLLEKFKAAETKGEDHRVRLVGYGFTFSGGISIAMPIEYTARYPVKSTGGAKYRTKRQNMVFNFCPFCGVRVREAKVAIETPK